GSDWETYNKSLEGQRYSPLSEINASNAAEEHLRHEVRSARAQFRRCRCGRQRAGDRLGHGGRRRHRRHSLV
ncbi:MAG TPA: hypothetical protein VN730_15855, partial [Steroidobacteraceae bacterium]|nr:hypothetical protein [Steroidobacteraceae bacterium]